MANGVSTKNTKKMQSKSRTHKVEPRQVIDRTNALFDVTSGSSGKVYTVHLIKSPSGVEATCDCEWGTRGGTAWGRGRNCSHVAAVMDYLAEKLGYTVSVWGDVEEAQRQHRRTWKVDGHYYTLRQI